jgi:putative tryptophan/tyrosine transport system substrate-binding protein
MRSLLVAAFARPLPVHAQRPTMPVIGLSSGARLELVRAPVTAFRRGLADAGFTERRNLAIEYQRHGSTHQDERNLHSGAVSRACFVVAPGPAFHPIARLEME